MIGTVDEKVWTLIGADPPEPPRRTRTRYARFASRREAEAWLAEQEGEGFACESGPAPLATAYHGPTDSPSNAWAVHVAQAVDG